jgi:hypothetical protein
VTPEEIQAARALVQAATPGPWKAPSGVESEGWRIHGALYAESDSGPADGEFIAAARTLVPRLLDALDEARERAEAAVVEARKAALHDASDWFSREHDGHELFGSTIAEMLETLAEIEDRPRARATKAEAAVVEARKAALHEAADEVRRIRNGESSEPGPYAGYIETWLRARARAQGPTPNVGHDGDAT